MKYNKLNISILFLLAFSTNRLNAQEAFTVSGGDASGNRGSTSYSIGQIAYTTNTGTTGSIAEGVQQVFDISVVTTIDKADDISLNYSVYPNPTIDYLNLKIDASSTLLNSPLNYRFYDLNGSLLETKTIENNETIIEMQKYLPAVYFLKVSDNEKEIITFKIIKIKSL